MARIRTIKPEILDDDRTACLSPEAFKLFIGLILLSDDHGNVRANERWLVGQVFWGCSTSRSFAEVLRELRDAELVRPYECRGQVYANIRSWSKHQRIDNAGKPRVPTPEDSESSWIDAVSDDSPQFAEIRGDSPLDHDPDHDHDHHHDQEAPSESASPARTPTPARGGGGGQRLKILPTPDSPIAERAKRYVDDPGARTHLGDPSTWPEVSRIVERYQQRFPSKVIRLKPYRADTRLQRIVERLAEGTSPLELEACIVAASEAAKANKLDHKFQRLDALLANPGQVDRWLSETPTRVRESLGLSPRAAAS